MSERFSDHSRKKKNEHLTRWGFSQHRIKVFLSVFVFTFVIIALLIGIQIGGRMSQLHGSADEVASFEYGNVDGNVFADVAGDHKNAYALAYLKGREIISGYDDDTFRPDELMNRGGFIKLIANANSVFPHRVHYSNCFADVNDEWFATYVCYAAEVGWIDGSAEHFFPERNITRAEALKILIKAFGVELIEDTNLIGDTMYTDIDSVSWYAPFVVTAEQKGWLDGLFDGHSFGAMEEMRRAEVSELIFRILVTELPSF